MLFNIDSPWAPVAEMERQLKLNEDVIRQLTIKVEELEEGPSAGMLAKQARERRDAKWGDPRRREASKAARSAASKDAPTGADRGQTERRPEEIAEKDVGVEL